MYTPHFFSFSVFVALVIVSVQASESLLVPQTVLTPQQCPYAFDVYKDAASGVVLVACANLGVLAIAPNGTISIILSQAACWSPMYLRAYPARGVIYVPCNPTLQPAPTDATSFALSGVGFNQVSVVTTGKQCDWVNDFTWDSATDSLLFGCLGTQPGLYRLTSDANLTLLVPDEQCPSPANFALVPPLLFMSCNPDLPNEFHLGEYNLMTSQFTPVIGRELCLMNSWPIVKKSSPITFFAPCFQGPIVNVTISASGPLVSNLSNSLQCDDPSRIFSTSDEAALYASCSSAGVISIDLQSRVATSLLSNEQCQQPSSVFVDEFSNQLYATCVNSGLLLLPLSPSLPEVW